MSVPLVITTVQDSNSVLTCLEIISVYVLMAKMEHVKVTNLIYVTRFEITRLPCTQQQVVLFTIT